jgi:hypothetical protein
MIWASLASRKGAILLKILVLDYTYPVKNSCILISMYAGVDMNEKEVYEQISKYIKEGW